MGAFGKDKVTGGLVMGFGCHLIPEMAAQRALTELCQLIPIRDQNAAPFDFDLIEVGEHLEGSSELKSNTYAIKPSSDIKDDISAVVSQLKLNGMEVMALNYSRAHIPLFTAKVFVPGLCHIWPQLANERLYQAPIKMGYLAIANTEQSINQQALYI
jgi:ribosomal protein S12 methylthiotransferase accessory factor